MRTGTAGFYIALLTAFLVAVAQSPVALGAEPDVSRPIKDKWALVIGISEFQDLRSNLRFAAKDARDFRNFLVNEANFAPDHVRLLTNSNATRLNIMEELGDRWLPHVVGPDDLVLLFISSHGSPAEADVVGFNYIIAYDTQPDALYATGIPTQDLIRMIKMRLKSDRIVAILDACFSGSAADPDPTGAYKQRSLDVDEFVYGTGGLVICSSQPDETSFESPALHNGVFTHYLIEGLRRDGDSTRLVDAFNYCKDKVQEHARLHRTRQTPVMKSKWQAGGLMVAALPGQRPAMPGSEPPMQVASTVSPPVPERATEVASVVPPPRPPHPPLSSAPAPASGRTDVPAGAVTAPAATSASTTTAATAASLAPASGTGALPSNVAWGKNQTDGARAEKAGNLQEAERCFRVAVAEGEKFGPNDLRLAGSLNSLALVLDQTARSKEAEQLMRRALGIYQQALGPEHRYVASVLTNLGQIKETQGDLEVAEEMYTQALKIMQVKLGPNDPHMANTLGRLGELAMKQGNYDEAERNMKRALQIKETAYGRESKQAAIQLNSLALLSEARHRYDEAEVQYREALRIMEKVLPANSLDVAAAMNNLGRAYSARGMYDKAEPLIAKAVEIHREKKSSHYPIALYQLADVYTGLGKFEQAEKMYEEALRITQAAYGLQHPVVAVIYHSLGIMYYKEKRYPEAQLCFERALSVKQKLYSPQHQEIAATCVALANAYRDERKYDKADPLYQKALDIYKRVLGPKSWDVYYTAKKYWRLLEDCQRNAEADKMKAIWTALEPQFSR